MKIRQNNTVSKTEVCLKTLILKTFSEHFSEKVLKTEDIALVRHSEGIHRSKAIAAEEVGSRAKAGSTWSRKAIPHSC